MCYIFETLTINCPICCPYSFYHKYYEIEYQFLRMKGIIFNVISSGLHISSSQPRTYFNENAVFYMILGMISKICITLIVFIDINPNLNLLNLTY